MVTGCMDLSLVGFILYSEYQSNQQTKRQSTLFCRLSARTSHMLSEAVQGLTRNQHDFKADDFFYFASTLFESNIILTVYR